MRSFIGLHLQTPVDGWEEEFRRAAQAGVPYRVGKFFWVEAGKIVKSFSGQTITVFRHYLSHQQPLLDRAFLSPEEADRAADEYILQFKDSINQHGGIDYVESLNETYPSEDLVAQTKAVAFDRAFIRRLRVHCPNVKAVVYTAPPGNIDHDEYGILVPLARDAQLAGAAFGYHNYWSVVNGQSFVNSPQHARDYHMRWSVTLDAYMVTRGIFLKYILGESGAIGASPNGYWQRPNDGWLKDDVWNGNQDGYLSDFLSMDYLYRNTLAAQQNRLLGTTLFTSGYAGWDLFQVRRPFLSRVTDYVISSVTNPPPPTPPPPPGTTLEHRLWAASVREQEQNGLRLNPDAALGAAIRNSGRTVVHNEITEEGYVIQAGEDEFGTKPRKVYVWSPGQPVWSFIDPG